MAHVNSCHLPAASQGHATFFFHALERWETASMVGQGWDGNLLPAMLCGDRESQSSGALTPGAVSFASTHVFGIPPGAA